MKKPIGVYVLLPSGERWMFCRDAQFLVTGDTKVMFR